MRSSHLGITGEAWGPLRSSKGPKANLKRALKPHVLTLPLSYSKAAKATFAITTTAHSRAEGFRLANIGKPLCSCKCPTKKCARTSCWH